MAAQRSDILDAVTLSLKVATLATLIALVLGTLAAAALWRRDFFGKNAISLLLLLPIALPGIVTGLADVYKRQVQGNVMLHQRGYAKMFMIFKEDELIGVISFNRIEPLNKTAEIGYWLDESHQGQGIISQALQALIHHYAQSGELRRFVIKCRVDNPQSNQVALRNGFILEGCLKQAEFLNDAYDDVNLYARIIDSQ